MGVTAPGFGRLSIYFEYNNIAFNIEYPWTISVTLSVKILLGGFTFLKGMRRHLRFSSNVCYL